MILNAQKTHTKTIKKTTKKKFRYRIIECDNKLQDLGM